MRSALSRLSLPSKKDDSVFPCDEKSTWMYCSVPVFFLSVSFQLVGIRGPPECLYKVREHLDVLAPLVVALGLCAA